MAMELTLDEAVVLELMKALKAKRGRIDKLSLEKLVFLVAHGEFNERGELVGLRAFPRLGVDYRVYFKGVHSRDIHEILDRLRLKGLVTVDQGRIEIADISDVTPSINDPDVRRAVENAARYASLDPKELEELINSLLGIKSETAKALVFNASVVKLLKAREEAKKLRSQGLLVDV
ncbi:MAG: hypothetical protein GSR85_00120 [Desulfurococcales archaeon]|nr:hypothetical protein [Desulfurococcales archaeon]